MGHWWYCCQHADCIIFEDDFNRLYVGNNWDIIVGDWSCNGAELVEAGDPTAVIITAASYTNEERIIIVDLVDPQPNKVFAVFVNWLDADNYLYAIVDCEGGSPGKLTVGQVVGGVDTEVDDQAVDYTPGETATLTICRNKSGIYADLSTTSAFCWGCVDETGGKKDGLGNRGELEIEFDNFVRWMHYEADPDCPPCYCDCDGHCTKPELLITWSAVGTGPYDCSECGVDGQEVEIDRNDNLQPYFGWEGRQVIGVGPECVENEVGFRLLCGNTPEEWILCTDLEDIIDDDESCGGDPWFWGANPSSYSCNPFIMVFGPFTSTISSDPPSECTITLTVTERP